MKKTLAFVTLLVVAVVVFVLFITTLTDNSGITHHFSQVSIRDIAKTEQLRVLSVQKELLIGQTRITHGLFSDNVENIYVIYPSTLNLGFDLAKCDTTSIKTTGDSVRVVLPPVQILNKDGKAVDEASKRTPIEEGQWSAEEMTDLRERAEAVMVRQCEYDSCYQKAERLGVMMVSSALQKLGFSNVEVVIQKRSDAGLWLTENSFNNRNNCFWGYRYGRPCITFRKDGRNAGILYYYRKNIRWQQLLTLVDGLKPLFTSSTREAEVLMKNKQLYLIFHNPKVKIGSAEAEKVKKSFNRKRMESIANEVTAKMLLPNRVVVQEVDKDRKVICTL